MHIKTNFFVLLWSNDYIEDKMVYHHLAHIIHENARKYGDEEAIKTRLSPGNWGSISWNSFSRKVMDVAEALYRSGANPGDNIGVYSQNMAECLYIDFGAFANRLVMVPMFATSSVPQITYIINEAQIATLFVGEQWQYDNAYVVLKDNAFLKQLVIIDDKVVKDKDDDSSVYFSDFCRAEKNDPDAQSAVQARMKEAKDDDLAHIIYTSGTTGEPKGVMLTHFNYIEVCKTHDIRLNYLPRRFLSMCFLPMTHIFEKAWLIYCFHRGCNVAIGLDPREIQTYLKEVRPEAMCSVPRFWEKFYGEVQVRLESYPAIVRKLFKDALKTGEKYVLGYRNKSLKAPRGLQIKFSLYDKTVYTILKKIAGIEKGLIFPTAGAALSDKINIFLQSLNIPLIYGYGLTETTATVSCFPHVDFEIGTVGKVMPDTEVRISDIGEIEVKANSVMKGYYKKPEATAEVFTADGFFKTGDAGRLTEKQGIILTERIKDLYKTSNGKYIAPQQLEGRLTNDKYIEGAIVIGDQRKYVTALIIPAEQEVIEYAQKNNIPFESAAELYRDALIVDLFNERIRAMQDEFATYEQIKRISLLSEPFTIQAGELTNTLKMRRAFIAEKYRDIIDKMYE